MNLISRFYQSWHGMCWRCRRAYSTTSNRIAVGDRLVLRMKEDPSRIVFTKPLKAGKSVATKWGNLEHDYLIGKEARDTVTFSTGREFRLHLPTLGEYVELTPRLVTPVYPADSNLIISLLDIHVSSQKSQPEDPPFEILEAGTGHGALTLHLARAIHAANPSPPPELLMTIKQSTEQSPSDTGIVPRENSLADDETPANSTDIAPDNGPSEHAMQNWKVNRGAVIHTVEISAEHSEHAQKIFRGFRRGMYAGDADFYVGDVSEWIDRQSQLRGLNRPEQADKTFLSHVILDLPDSYKHVAKAASVLRADGVIMVFNPSITQIIACVQLIRDKKLPLVLDRVIELGPGMTGGKDWDVRVVKPRALLKREKAEEEALAAVDDTTLLEPETSAEMAGDEKEQLDTRSKAQAKILKQGDTGFETICRPKAWARVMGGGFLGVLRKMKHSEVASGK